MKKLKRIIALLISALIFVAFWHQTNDDNDLIATLCKCTVVATIICFNQDLMEAVKNNNKNEDGK